MVGRITGNTGLIVQQLAAGETVLVTRPRIRKPATAATVDWYALHNVRPAAGVTMGVDASLTSTGVSIIVGSTFTVERLRPPTNCANHTRRLRWFYEEFQRLLRVHQPACVGIEGYSFGSKFSRKHATGELGGVIRLALSISNVPEYRHIPPNTGKQFATGAGNADKESVSKELFKRFGVDLNQNDLVDSVMVGLTCHASIYPEAFNLTKAQIASLTKVEIVPTA